MATNAEVESFIDRFYAIAQDIQERFSIPASVVLGQAALESGWGTSEQATKYNNYFGVKRAGDAGTKLMMSKEYENGKEVYRASSFGAYSSPERSFEDYAKVLQLDYYKDAYQTNNPFDFISAVASGGYATDTNYAQLVSDIIKGRNLTQYDLPMGGGGAVTTQPAQQEQGLTREQVLDKLKDLPISGDLSKASDEELHQLLGMFYADAKGLTKSTVNEKYGDVAASWNAHGVEEYDLSLSGKIARMGIIILIFIALIVLIVLAIPSPQKSMLTGALKGAVNNG